MTLSSNASNVTKSAKFLHTFVLHFAGISALRLWSLHTTQAKLIKNAYAINYRIAGAYTQHVFYFFLLHSISIRIAAAANDAIFNSYFKVAQISLIRFASHTPTQQSVLLVIQSLANGLVQQ